MLLSPVGALASHERLDSHGQQASDSQTDRQQAGKAGKQMGTATDGETDIHTNRQTKPEWML